MANVMNIVRGKTDPHTVKPFRVQVGHLSHADKIRRNKSAQIGR
jgi:hypothetical protein